MEKISIPIERTEIGLVLTYERKIGDTITEEEWKDMFIGTLKALLNSSLKSEIPDDIKRHIKIISKTVDNWEMPIIRR
jgi:hypothetical protein